MARNRTLYVIFVLACVIFSAAYRSRISAVLLIAAALYPLLVLLLSAISLYTLRAEFPEKRVVYEKLEQFELPVMLHNNFLFPFAPAEFDCLLPDNDTGLFLHKQIYVAVGPLRRMRIFVPCMHRYRGSYTAQILRLTVYDPLKVIRLSRKLSADMQLVILPRKIPLPDLGMIFGGEQGSMPDRRQGGEREDISHVREYMQGDIMQLIHWKLTAKLDDMMVKQYDTTGDCRSVLLCDFSHTGSSVSAMIRQSDAVAEAAIAVAMSCVSGGVHMLADTGTASGGKVMMADMQGFERFYETLSILPPYTEAEYFPELIRRYSVGDTATMLLVTHTVNEKVFDAAEDAASRISGTVVLIYVNCTGRNDYPERDENSRFVFAQVNGEPETALSAAAEQLLADYLRLN